LLFKKKKQQHILYKVAYCGHSHSFPVNILFGFGSLHSRHFVFLAKFMKLHLFVEKNIPLNILNVISKKIVDKMTTWENKASHLL
jgi:UDP-N-acetylglucosamine:LPS N-acetylglucosamine transferase